MPPLHLQWCLSIELKLGHLLTPRQQFLGLVVQEIVEDGPLVGELDVLEFRHPPLRELHTVVHQLLQGEGREVERRAVDVWLNTECEQFHSCLPVTNTHC